MLQQLLIIGLTAAAMIGSSAGIERVGFTYSILEEQTTPRIIGNLVDDTGLRWNETFRRDVQFRLIKNSLLPRNLLRVDTAGNLVLQQRLDREALCRGVPDCSDPMQFDVLTSAMQPVALIDIQLNIDDINDNRPIFDPDVMEINISEAAIVGHVIQLPAARDPDSPKFGVQPEGYQLEGSRSDVFQLVTDPSGPATLGPRLRLLKPLDRESESRYLFVLRAADRGVPVNTGTLSLVINVLDENDQAPVIVSGCSDVYKDEDVPVGSVLTTIVARDADIGENARLRYRIRSMVGVCDRCKGPIELPQSTQDLLTATFQINPVDGSLSIAKSLDYESYTSVTLAIEVADSGQPPRSTECLLRVIVRDKNDNKPQISVLGLRPGGRIEIPESQPAEKAPIAYLNAEDKDAGEAGRVTCVAVSPDLKLRESRPYLMFTTAVFDRENVSLLTWSVSCRDNGSPPQITEVYFNVTIGDINDNSPKFRWTYKRISIDEGRQPGDLILDLRATDADEGENARISYSIDPFEMTRFFRILDNGTLVAASVLDRETQETYQFNVVATDHGSPPLSARSEVHITLADINDCPPSFERSTMEFSVPENAGIGHLVGRVQAIDRDSGNGGQVVYTPATEGNDAARAFRLDREGNIRVDRTLDREEQDKYFIRVMATDMGTPQLNGSGTVIIRVEDVNDNTPVVRWPNLINHTVTVSYLTRPRTVVCSIDAVDNDVGPNAQLVFSLRPSSGAALFDVNSSNGGVFVRRDLSKAEIGRYELQIDVRDTGQPAMTTVAHLMLLVDDSQPPTASGLSASEMNFLLIIVICSVTFVLSCILVASIWHTRRRLGPSTNRLYASGKCCTGPGEADPTDSKTPMETHTMVDLPLESLDNRLKVSHASLYSRGDCIMPLHHCHLHDYDSGLPVLNAGPAMPRPVQRGETSGQSSESDSGRGTCFIDDDPFREHVGVGTLTIGGPRPPVSASYGGGVTTFTLDKAGRDAAAAHAHAMKPTPRLARGGGGGGGGGGLVGSELQASGHLQSPQQQLLHQRLCSESRLV